MTNTYEQPDAHVAYANQKDGKMGVDELLDASNELRPLRGTSRVNNLENSLKGPSTNSWDASEKSEGLREGRDAADISNQVKVYGGLDAINENSDRAGILMFNPYALPKEYIKDIKAGDIEKIKKFVEVGMTENGIPVINEEIIIDKKSGMNQRLDFIAKVVLLGLIVQVVLFALSKVSKRGVDSLTLLIVYIFPLLVKPLWIPWAAYTCVLIYHLFIQKDTLRLLYLLSMLMQTIYLASIVLQAVLLLGFLLKFSIIDTLFALISCLSFSIISRDIADYLTSTSGLPSFVPAQSCYLCGGSLRKSVYTLGCSHSFHMVCIDGWLLLSKKEVCPYCRMEVNSQNVKIMIMKNKLFTSLLNYLKGIIVFIYVLRVGFRIRHFVQDGVTI